LDEGNSAKEPTVIEIPHPESGSRNQFQKLLVYDDTQNCA
jgi:hypothetical protein